MYNRFGKTLGSAALTQWRSDRAAHPRIVVSLTTLPARIERVVETISSLLKQTVPPDAIYLNVPTESKRFKGVTYVIPSELAKLDKLTIQRTVDYGPATKLIATLDRETDPDTLIITVDDDMVYAPSMVATLLEAHLLEPNAAFGFAGQMIDLDACNASVPWPNICMSRVHVRSVDEWKDRHAAVDILEAFKGAIYRRGFFDLDRLKRIPRACRRTDDIWISANLAMVGVPRVKLLTVDHPTMSANDGVTPLRQDNVQGVGQNDLCAQELLETFLSMRNSKPSACPVRFQELTTKKIARGSYYSGRAYYHGHGSPCTPGPGGSMSTTLRVVLIVTGVCGAFIVATRRSQRFRTIVRRRIGRSAILSAALNRLGVTLFL